MFKSLLTRLLLRNLLPKDIVPTFYNGGRLVTSNVSSS